MPTLSFKKMLQFNCVDTVSHITVTIIGANKQHHHPCFNFEVVFPYLPQRERKRFQNHFEIECFHNTTVSVEIKKYIDSKNPQSKLY